MDSNKHAHTCIYWRAYERDSHKHANTSTRLIYHGAYERAYEDSHKHAHIQA